METRTTRIGLVTAVLLLLAGLAVLPAPPAAAQLPGANGLVTFNRGGVNFAAHPDGSGARRISPPGADDVPVHDGPASFSPDGERIAFARTVGYGMREIYTARADGTDLVQVTFDQQHDKQAPSWSPDGTRLVFSGGGDQRLTIIGADGTGQVALSPTHANSPSFSPDGETILYYAYSSTTGSNDLYTVPAAGGAPTRLTGGVRDELNLSPDYSPDGSQIVFVSNRQPSPFAYDRIWVMDSDGSDLRLLHADGKYDGKPRWSPDGTRILFDGWTPDGSRLFTMDPDGSNLTQLATGAAPGEQDRTGSWQRAAAPSPPSQLMFNRDGVNHVAVFDGADVQVRRISDPSVDGSSVFEEAAVLNADGTRIAFARSEHGGMREIWVADADGSNPTRLTDDQGNDKQLPSWSPDGARIVFVHGPGARLSVMDADGTDRLDLGPAEVSHPTFSADGRSILYADHEAGVNDIYRIPAEGGTPVRLTSGAGTLNLMPKESPDGSRILFMSNRDPAPYAYERIWVMDSDGSDPVLLHADGKYDSRPLWSPDGARIAFGGWSPEGNRAFTMDADGSDLAQLDLGAGQYEQERLGSWGPLAALVPPTPPSDPTGPPPTTSTTAPPATDTTPPAIDLRVPADGAVYQVGEVVTADYECTDPSGVGLCFGSALGQHVPDGQQLDTSVTGVVAFIVETHDDLDPWNDTYETVVYSVVAPHGTAAARVDDGGVVTTDPDGLGATAEAPVQTEIVAPTGVSGVITAAPQPTTTDAPTGFSMFGTETVLEGPVATATEPYTVTFTVDSSALGGVAPADVQVYRDGVAVTGCTHPTAAAPDPCVVHRGWAPDGSGDAVVTVRTSHFSTWSLGRPDYELTGPFAPVEAAPAVNVGKAGSTIPVRFRLGGDHGLDVLADGAGTSLRYDPATGTYTYLWRTTKEMAGSRQLVLRFRDGSELRTVHRLR